MLVKWLTKSGNAILLFGDSFWVMDNICNRKVIGDGKIDVKSGLYKIGNQMGKAYANMVTSIEEASTFWSIIFIFLI